MQAVDHQWVLVPQRGCERSTHCHIHRVVNVIHLLGIVRFNRFRLGAVIHQTRRFMNTRMKVATKVSVEFLMPAQIAKIGIPRAIAASNRAQVMSSRPGSNADGLPMRALGSGSGDIA